MRRRIVDVGHYGELETTRTRGAAFKIGVNQTASSWCARCVLFQSFDHRPILAGRDESGQSLYLAVLVQNANKFSDRASESQYYRTPNQRMVPFCTVRDGDEQAEFWDEDGKMHVIDHFMVFVLRYDDRCYKKSLLERARLAESVDATGPVMWQDFN